MVLDPSPPPLKTRELEKKGEISETEREKKREKESLRECMRVYEREREERGERESMTVYESL